MKPRVFDAYRSPIKNIDKNQISQPAQPEISRSQKFQKPQKNGDFSMLRWLVSSVMISPLRDLIQVSGTDSRCMKKNLYTTKTLGRKRCKNAGLGKSCDGLFNDFTNSAANQGASRLFVGFFFRSNPAAFSVSFKRSSYQNPPANSKRVYGVFPEKLWKGVTMKRDELLNSSFITIHHSSLSG